MNFKKMLLKISYENYSKINLIDFPFGELLIIY